jgi:hypothetical protein
LLTSLVASTPKTGNLNNNAVGNFLDKQTHSVFTGVHASQTISPSQNATLIQSLNAPSATPKIIAGNLPQPSPENTHPKQTRKSPIQQKKLTKSIFKNHQKHL